LNAKHYLDLMQQLTHLSKCWRGMQEGIARVEVLSEKSLATMAELAAELAKLEARVAELERRCA
jgi:cell division protein FtsB